MDIREIEIPIFLHPHLFWIFWRKNNTKRFELQNELSKVFSKSQPKDEEFEIGEIVAVNKNLIWKRAIIEKIFEDGQDKFEVWLLDYGHLEYCNEVYKLDPKFNIDNLPALVIQASLYNVVFLNEDLNWEKNSVDVCKNQFPNSGATMNALQLIGNYQLFFKKSKEVNGVLFGDILYKRNGETSSLTASLITKKLMVEDKELFAKIESTRLKDKMLHSVALRQYSKNHEDSRFSFDASKFLDEVFMRNTSRGISSIFNNENQSPETSSPRKELTKVELLKNMRRKAERKKMETMSCTESEREESLVDSGGNPSLNMDKQLSKATRLKNFINRKKSANEAREKSLSASSGSELSITSNEVPVSSKLAMLKLRCNTLRENKNNYHETKEKIGEKLKVDNGSPKEQNTALIPGEVRNYEIRESVEFCDDVHSESTKGEKSPLLKTEKLKNLIAQRENENTTSDSSNKAVVRNTSFQKSSFIKNEVNELHSNDSLDTESFEKEFESQDDISSGTKCTPDNARDSQMVIKPYCKCVQCNFWTTSEDWGIGSEHFTEEAKCERKKMRPSSLLLKQEREENIKLCSINYSLMTKIEKKSSFKILVHGRLLPKPVDLVVEAPFHPAIHRCLKNLKYLRTKKAQSYIWPAISRSMNVCLIHRSKTGKTLAYLPPLCSFLFEREERYSDMKKGGPVAIILGKSSTECEDIFELTNKLMERAGHNKPRILLVTYPFQYVNLRSVDMLITIPPILIELLKRNATNLKRLCHLVLENNDVLLEKFPEEFKSIISAIENMLLQRTIRQNVQIIVTGEHWTQKLEKFLMKLRDLPLVAIGDYLEASIYGGIKLKVKFLPTIDKCDAVVDILMDKWKFHKCVLICNTNEEIKQLTTTLDLASISYISITDDLSLEEALQNEYNWESHTGGQYIVLLCTDEVLHTMLTITSASLIIHFSLPTKWSSWVKRFYCLLDNNKSPLVKCDEKLKSEGYVLTDELNMDQIPRLLLLLKDFNVSLQQFEPVHKQLVFEKEQSKIMDKIPLCSSLKQFGYCHRINCPERHLLECELDYNKPSFQNGTIKYKIVKLVDVNHLKVNIIEHKDVKGNITEYNSNNNDEKLTSIMNQEKTLAKNIEKLSTYAYWDQEDFNDMFRECIVENVLSDVVDILVKFDGKRTTVSKSKIFQLPEGYNSKSDTDLILANFKPPYKDDRFSIRAFSRLKSFLEEIEHDDNIFISNICLQLGNTIWVNTVYEEVNVYKHSLTKSNITKELVRKQLAENNQSHMENLYALCRDAGIILPKYVIPVEEQIIREPPQATPQWAFLEMEIHNKVYFTSAVTPDEIYVRLAKFDSLLNSLEKDLFEVAVRQGSKQDFTILEGRYYLAKDPLEDKYIRVLIRKIEDGRALCFSVDYGDEFIVPLGDIRYLSNYMIQKLPFQAIYTRLFGIKSIEEEWPLDTVDVLYQNFTFENESDIYRTLYARCILYDKGINKGQLFFSILLKNIFEKPILINQLLIDCGWANLIPGVTLTDFEVEVTDCESEEETLLDCEIDDVGKVKEIIDTSKSISSNIIQPNKYNKYHSDKTENDLELFFCESGDEVNNFINFVETLMQNSAQETTTASHINTLPAIEAAPFEVDYLTPDVYWSQTKKRIDVYVRIPNVKTYSVKLLKSRIFNLETEVNEKKYVVNLVLYESVEKQFKHSLGGLEIKITFMKRKEEEWPKLSKNKHKLRNVHYLLSKEEMEDDDDNKKLFLDLGEDLQVLTDNESDGAIYDVISDRDSEYDLELPDDVDVF